jgi:hypothetical protein
MTVVGSRASIGAHGDENLADLLQVGLVEAAGQHLRYLGRPFLRVRLVDVVCCVLDREILVDGGFPLLRAILGSVDADAFDIDQAGLLVKYVRTPIVKYVRTPTPTGKPAIWVGGRSGELVLQFETNDSANPSLNITEIELRIAGTAA